MLHTSQPMDHLETNPICRLVFVSVATAELGQLHGWLSNLYALMRFLR